MDQAVTACGNYLKQHHIKYLEEWLEACIEWIAEENNGLPSSNELTNLVYEQWLMADLSEISLPSLPLGFSTGKAHSTLQGKYCVQINSIIDIGHSAYSQLQKIKGQEIDEHADDEEEDNNMKEFFAKGGGGSNNKNNKQNVKGAGGKWKETSSRMLLMELTDGSQTVEAIEYQPIPQMKLEEVNAGGKILLIGPIVCFDGTLLLKSNNIQLLGGNCEQLVENTQQKILSTILNIEDEGNAILNQNQNTNNQTNQNTNNQTNQNTNNQSSTNQSSTNQNSNNQTQASRNARPANNSNIVYPSSSSNVKIEIKNTSTIQNSTHNINATNSLQRIDNLFDNDDIFDDVDPFEIDQLETKPSNNLQTNQTNQYNAPSSINTKHNKKPSLISNKRDNNTKQLPSKSNDSKENSTKENNRQSTFNIPNKYTDQQNTVVIENDIFLDDFDDFQLDSKTPISNRQQLLRQDNCIIPDIKDEPNFPDDEDVVTEVDTINQKPVAELTLDELVDYEEPITFMFTIKGWFKTLRSKLSFDNGYHLLAVITDDTKYLVEVLLADKALTRLVGYKSSTVKEAAAGGLSEQRKECIRKAIRKAEKSLESNTWSMNILMNEEKEIYEILEMVSTGER